MFVFLSLSYLLNMAISVSSIFLKVTYFNSFLWPNKTPLCICTIFLLSSSSNLHGLDVLVFLWNGDSTTSVYEHHYFLIYQWMCYGILDTSCCLLLFWGFLFLGFYVLICAFVSLGILFISTSF